MQGKKKKWSEREKRDSGVQIVFSQYSAFV